MKIRINKVTDSGAWYAKHNCLIFPNTTLMNETYLPFERAARAYCKSADLDPDALAGHPPDPDPATGLAFAILIYSPRWIMVAKQLANQHAMNESLRNNPPSV